MKKRPTGDSDDDDAICCLSFSLSPLPSHYIGEWLRRVASRLLCGGGYWMQSFRLLPPPPPPLRIVSVYAAASVWTMVRNRTTHPSTSSSISSSSSLAMIIFLIVYRVHYYIVLSSVSVYQQATSSTLTWPFSCRMSSRPPSPSKALIRIGNKTFCCKFRLLFLFLVELFVCFFFLV